ncbi:MAG: site-specific DNA-methyltransferase [Candidatus Nanopelagicales bacterium]
MLHWRGKRPFSSTQYYPAQHKETHGPEVEGWRNKIYWGDNLQVMSHLLKEYRGQVQLIYIDPPFDSKADYKKVISLRGTRLSSEYNGFEEKQYTDIWNNDEYLQFMYERFIMLRELLAQNGVIYLHCDPNRSHYLKILLDEIFGSSNYINEIVWQRISAHNDANKFGTIHDTIFFYKKQESYVWNQHFGEVSKDYIEQFFDQVDEETGRRYARGDLTARGIRRGETGKPWRGINPSDKGNHWKVVPSELDRLDAEGKIHWPQKDGGMPRLKRFEDDVTGRPLQDIWTDIKLMHNNSSERLGYPTQKPESLVERIIRASSNPGDLVFDCFMGSGTTQAVAMKLGRRFIGADINLGAVQITTKRLLSMAKELEAKPIKAPTQPELLITPDELDGEEEEAISTVIEPTVFYPGFEVYNVNHYDVFRNPVQARDLLLEALEINRLAPGHVFDGEKDGRMVKLMPVNRIATRADLNDLLANMDYKAFERRQGEQPNKPVEKITLVCMGHEPDLAAVLQGEVKQNGYRIDVEVVDILRDKQELQFKRDAEARVVAKGGQLVIEAFYPMNLLSKLSLQAESVEEWRELVESVMIDWNYDGAVLQPVLVDVPEKDGLVAGSYAIPKDAGTIRVKITDLLSESLEVEVIIADLMTDRILVPKTPLSMARASRPSMPGIGFITWTPSASGSKPLSTFRNGTTCLTVHR